MTRWRERAQSLYRGVSLIVVLTLTVVGARAEDLAGAGLDLLVIVDRSGSMSEHVPATVIDALPMTLNVVAWSGRSARLKHRFGVVSFGSAAGIDVPLTIVDADQLVRLRDRVGRLGARSLGNTNFPAAFEAAAEAFRVLPDDRRRRRAILLLTDGRPAVPGVRVSEMRARLDHVMDGRLKPPTTLDVVLFAPERETGQWHRLARNRVHSVGGDRADVLEAVHRIVTSLVGTRSTQEHMAGPSHTLVLPPYLDLVVFDVLRSGAGLPVTVLPPDSSVPLDSQSPGVEEVRVGDVLSTIVVRRPHAGAWTFTKSYSTARVRVLSQQFFPRGTLVEPTAARPVSQHAKVTIGYRLDDEAGRPLRELDGYPLSVDLSLTVPDGHREVFPLMSRPAPGATLYRSTRPATCDVAGRYWTEVLVTTADSTGQPVRVFEDRWSGFAVEDVRTPAIEAAPVPRAQRNWWPAAIIAVALIAGVAVVMWRR
jgi:hypothetical protein